MPFPLLPKNPSFNRNVSCVYRVWFGVKYYIGKTKDMKARMYQHGYDLAKHLKNYGEPLDNPYYVHLLKHIVDNSIASGNYEILNLCKDEKERVLFEQMWFNSCCDDPNCLNYGYESHAFVLRPGTQLRHECVTTNKQKLVLLRKTLKNIAK